MRLMIVLGSVRKGRQAEKVANWAVQQLQDDPEIELDVADLKEVSLPFFDEPKSPDANGGQYENPVGAAWAKRVGKAEAFIFLVAEYNHGPTAVLKNAIDWVYEEWANKPVGFISYGAQVGGARAVEQLRQIVLSVRLKPESYAIHIPRIETAFKEDGRPEYDKLDESVTKLVAAIKSHL